MEAKKLKEALTLFNSILSPNDKMSYLFMETKKTKIGYELCLQIFKKDNLYALYFKTEVDWFIPTCYLPYNDFCQAMKETKKSDILRFEMDDCLLNGYKNNEPFLSLSTNLQKLPILNTEFESFVSISLDYWTEVMLNQKLLNKKSLIPVSDNLFLHAKDTKLETINTDEIRCLYNYMEAEVLNEITIAIPHNMLSSLLNWTAKLKGDNLSIGLIKSKNIICFESEGCGFLFPEKKEIKEQLNHFFNSLKKLMNLKYDIKEEITVSSFLKNQKIIGEISKKQIIQFKNMYFQEKLTLSFLESMMDSKIFIPISEKNPIILEWKEDECYQKGFIMPCKNPN